MEKLQRKIALITGVSSERDMGTAICRKLASQGIDIFFTHWNSSKEWPDRFVAELSELGVQSASLEIDLSTAQAAREVLDTVSKQIGFPSILINNAAHSTRDGYLKLDAKTLEDHYAVNMRTTFLLSVEFARRFTKSKVHSGRIINMTSGQDLGPMPNELAYVATKGAISAFTRTLAAEVGSIGITVNAVDPGPTDSTWMTDEIRKWLLPRFPMGRIGLPEDAASLIGFLASEDGKWITGQVIHSNGGFNLG
ncbi:SDR family oxidoreductase [Bacillus horti]|uniref:3-oxoacyl-[acyl-carrier protein] reductase n=1 Tax=Caldalkalibacillus horti TaxID=77523 RepID=A0ABT9VZW7_9BACI|nr:SDR family oxidoreductase [Bacillus horti]MDQ0166512.1 3-oxoacyl-[acyl-carrier protein] reductase [Bacillus horti]